MTDLWDEKPDKDQWGSFKHPVKSGEKIQLLVYDSAEIDAWLEIIKTCLDVLTVEVERLKLRAEKWDMLPAKPPEILLKRITEGREAENRLEAVKTVAKLFTKDDWNLIETALNTMSLEAKGMDLIDINELVSHKLLRLRAVAEGFDIPRGKAK